MDKKKKEEKKEGRKEGKNEGRREGRKKEGRKEGRKKGKKDKSKEERKKDECVCSPFSVPNSNWEALCVVFFSIFKCLTRNKNGTDDIGSYNKNTSFLILWEN